MRTFAFYRYIPVAFQVATLLAAFAHPDHLLLVGSRGFAYLLPSSNLKCFGYSQSYTQLDKRQVAVYTHFSGKILT
ncbi:MAG: hypothetical protein QS721_07450 [Candidatus Endonucleobacter sp. (ex Gigantidas childressi)]|nr:hypothetical protein [Candidatus Endonucleobacter sp. (ex Gigantidas childressi)]